MVKVTHLEIPADDIERAKRFYEEVFGWRISQLMTKESGGADYWVIMRNEKGPGINGGLYKRTADENGKFSQYDCTVQVKNIDEILEAIQENGGTIAKEKINIPDVGWFAGVIDTERNYFGIMQKNKLAA